MILCLIQEGIELFYEAVLSYSKGCAKNDIKLYHWLHTCWAYHYVRHVLIVHKMYNLCLWSIFFSKWKPLRSFIFSNFTLCKIFLAPFWHYKTHNHRFLAVLLAFFLPLCLLMITTDHMTFYMTTVTVNSPRRSSCSDAVSTVNFLTLRHLAGVVEDGDSRKVIKRNGKFFCGWWSCLRLSWRKDGTEINTTWQGTALREHGHFHSPQTLSMSLLRQNNLTCGIYLNGMYFSFWNRT